MPRRPDIPPLRNTRARAEYHQLLRALPSAAARSVAITSRTSESNYAMRRKLSVVRIQRFATRVDCGRCCGRVYVRLERGDPEAQSRARYCQQ